MVGSLAPAPMRRRRPVHFPMPSRLIGVEVVKGAAAIRYGPQTIGGAINLLTRRVPVNETLAQRMLPMGHFKRRRPMATPVTARTGGVCS